MADLTVAKSIRPRPYDVFLNFRGQDTRQTFVDHLYFALVRLGIHTYRDDITLHKGDIIHDSLKKAIEESQIAVTIFSKNYGDSSSCLMELAHIMKRMDGKKIIVIPIFYDVLPKDVKEQIGEFGVAFAKQLLLKNSSKVKSWEKALMAAGKISGYDPTKDNDGHEAENTYTIASKISERLKPSVVDSNAIKDLIGIETRKQDLISHLHMESGGVRMVGIWGIGGGGKTTLASSVYDEISDKFDSCCFVGNIRETSNKYGLQKLQEKVVFDVLKILVAARSVEERGWMIRSRLRLTKVLIVLDDVAHHDHLEALAGSRDWFGEGSRIIITTRDQHLLKVHQVDSTYDISLLNDEEATRLFDRHVLWKNMPEEDEKKLSMPSKDVVSYAGGIPLVLKVLGRFLYDKDRSEWTSALTRLTDIPDGDCVNNLKISFDGLKPVEQELFLDIACFFLRDQPKDEAMMILDACGFHSVVGIKVLIQKALISINKDNMFDMHDMIKEMAHYIVRGKHTHNLEKHSRIWRYEDIKLLCNWGATTVNENNKIQVLHSPNNDTPANLLEVVAKMKKLRFLYVRQNVQKLVDGPVFISNELRWISWEGYPASSLPTDFQPTKLVGLILKKGLQKELWKDSKELPSLKVLDLSDSESLTETPDFRGLPNLERLVLSCCSSLEEIHPSIGCQEKLVYMNLNGCIKLNMFPPIGKMQKLETLILSGCSQLQEFPEITQNMDSLRELCLDRSGIKVVPSSVYVFINPGSLSLIDCHNLDSVHLIDNIDEDDPRDIEGSNNRRIKQKSSAIFVGRDR